jgi:hypothetical protein
MNRNCFGNYRPVTARLIKIFYLSAIVISTAADNGGYGDKRT